MNRFLLPQAVQLLGLTPIKSRPLINAAARLMRPRPAWTNQIGSTTSNLTSSTQLPLQLPHRTFATIPKYPWGSSMRLSVGDTCTMTNTFTSDDVHRFGQSSHDWNPVHYPDLHQQTTESEIQKWKSNPATSDLPLPKTGIFRFSQPIVHGLLTASLIGTVFATHLPGSIYLSQNLNFRAPVYYNEPVTVKIEVIAIDRKRVTCKTQVEKVDTKTGQIVLVIDGEASVLVEGLQSNGGTTAEGNKDSSSAGPDTSNLKQPSTSNLAKPPEEHSSQLADSSSPPVTSTPSTPSTLPYVALTVHGARGSWREPWKNDQGLYEHFQGLTRQAEETLVNLRQRGFEDRTRRLLKNEVNEEGSLEDMRLLRVDSKKNSTAPPWIVSSNHDILPIQLPFPDIPMNELFCPLLPEDHALVAKHISLDYANTMQSLRQNMIPPSLRLVLKKEPREEFIARLELGSRDFQLFAFPTASPHTTLLSKESQQLIEAAKKLTPKDRFKDPLLLDAWSDLYTVAENSYFQNMTYGDEPLLLREIELFHMMSNILESRLSETTLLPQIREESLAAIQRFRYLAQIRMNKLMLLFPSVMQYLDNDQAPHAPWGYLGVLLQYFRCLLLASSDSPPRLIQIGPIMDYVASRLHDYARDHPPADSRDSDPFVQFMQLQSQSHRLIQDAIFKIQKSRLNSSDSTVKMN